MLSNEVKDVAATIGQFYLDKNGCNYEKTAQEITDLRISKIEIKDERIVINLSRVGLMIGRRGENIVNLQKCFEKKISLIEDMDELSYYLIPYNYNDEDMYSEDMWGDETPK